MAQVEPPKKDDKSLTPTPTPPPTPEDKRVEDEITRRVVEHVIKFEGQGQGQDAGAGTPSQPSQPVGSGTSGESIDDIKRRLTQTEKARQEMEEELTRLKKEHGTTKAELEEKQNMLASLALKEFEDKKNILVQKVRETQGDEKAEEVAEMIKTGKDIDQITRWMDIFDSAVKVGTGAGAPPQPSVGEPDTEPRRQPPAGKARGQKPTQDGIQNWASVEEEINEIYDNLEAEMFKRAMGLPHDAMKLQKYQTMATQLLQALLAGEKKRGRVTRLTVMQCRSCGKILTKGETKCPVCGQEIIYKQGGGI